MAAVLSHWFKKFLGVNRTGIVRYTATIVTTTNGDIDTTNTSAPGLSITKVGGKNGRYLVQLRNAGPAEDAVATKLCSVSAIVLGADDAAYTTAKGSVPIIRDDNMAAAGNFLLQLCRSDTTADAEVLDGASILLAFEVKASSASP